MLQMVDTDLKGLFRAFSSFRRDKSFDPIDTEDRSRKAVNNFYKLVTLELMMKSLNKLIAGKI